MLNALQGQGVPFLPEPNGSSINVNKFLLVFTVCLFIIIVQQMLYVIECLLVDSSCYSMKLISSLLAI